MNEQATKNMVMDIYDRMERNELRIEEIEERLESPAPIALKASLRKERRTRQEWVDSDMKLIDKANAEGLL